ncbi:hypothetical protein [Prochlorococcus marinus]|uniref:Lipoprotein n=1 Tax=Prochlorococcus marinus str. GP2 TaxID=59925 RepID=A0A0A1ZHE5_PROMR|nr:hypothetical protein [Prochlorococcus marinus]KGF87643.1 hypothetical protein EU91_0675 [Prochlorococcus marinus str. GP2]
MKKYSLQNFLFTLSGIILISSCSKSPSNVDLDLSSFKNTIPKPAKSIDNQNEIIQESKEVELNLISLDKKEDITSSIKYGKKDPFSSFGNDSNRSIPDFKLKGFLSLNNKDYAFVEYKNKEGIIDIDSIGDINTKLLPPKAVVKNISPSLETININLDDENYIIIMNLK